MKILRSHGISTLRSWRVVVLVCAAPGLAACKAEVRGPPAEQRAFFERVRALCDGRFTGRTTFIHDPTSPLADARLTVHVESCAEDRIRIPFHVDADSSRTWILTLREGGLELRHDHRRPDGTPDEITMYGGVAVDPGSPTSQSFPADEHTAEMLPEARTNRWTLEIDEERGLLIYDLQRDGRPRYRATFDLAGQARPGPRADARGAEGFARRPAADGSRQSEFVSVELATVGIDLRSRSHVVLLRDPLSDRVMPIWIGVAEAQAIARALHGIQTPRPMTHDLLADMLRELVAEVEEVRVHSLREGTYHGTIRLRVDGGDATREVDSRPSDAMALALRTGAPIRVAEHLLRNAPDINFMAPEGDQQVVHTMGVTVVAPNPELREEFGLPDRPGVVVIRTDLRARAAGLRRGDLILEVNGRVPARPIDLFDAVRTAPAGRPVELRYWRAGEESSVELLPRAPGPQQAPRDVRTEV